MKMMAFAVMCALLMGLSGCGGQEPSESQLRADLDDWLASHGDGIVSVDDLSIDWMNDPFTSSNGHQYIGLQVRITLKANPNLPPAARDEVERKMMVPPDGEQFLKRAVWGSIDAKRFAYGRRAPVNLGYVYLNGRWVVRQIAGENYDVRLGLKR